jgi:hypothetical protein
MGTVKTTLRHIGKRGGTDPPLGVSSRLSGKVWLSSSSSSSNNGSSIIKSFSTTIGKAAAAAATSTPTTTRATTTTFLTKTCTLNTALDSNTNRWKSTMASVMESDDEDEITINVSENIKNEGSKMATFENGHVKAARARMVDQQKNNTSSSLSLDESWRINLGRGSNNMWLTGPRNEDEWFTGLKPTDCPGVDSKGKIRSLPLPRLDAVTREAAKDYFDNSWTLYETLFAGLKGEEYFYRYVSSEGSEDSNIHCILFKKHWAVYEEISLRCQYFASNEIIFFPCNRRMYIFTVPHPMVFAIHRSFTTATLPVSISISFA